MAAKQHNPRADPFSPFPLFFAFSFDSITDPAMQAARKEYRAIGLEPNAIGRAIAYAIEQPPDVDVNEIIVRPIAGAQ